MNIDNLSIPNGMSNLHPEIVRYIQTHGMDLFVGAWNLKKLLKTEATVSPKLVGKPVVSVGGGWASTYELVKWTLDNKLDVTYAYCPILQDDKQLIAAVEKKFGITVHRIGPHGGVMPHSFSGFDVWHVFFAMRILGNSRLDPCSRVLKREAMAKFIKLHDIPKVYLGITMSEIDRMLAIKKNYKAQGIEAAAPLGGLPEANKVTKSLSIFGFSPSTYLQLLAHNNCGGWCVKAGKGHTKRWYWYNKEMAELYAWREVIFNLYFKTKKFYTVYREYRVIDGKSVSIRTPMFELYARWKKEWKGRMIPPYDEFDEGASTCHFCAA